MKEKRKRTPSARKYWLIWNLAATLLVLAMANAGYGAAGDTLLHNSANLGTKYWSGNGGWGISGGKFRQFTCQTCHNKDTTNIKRVTPAIATFIGISTTQPKPVIFRNITAFGTDADGHTVSKRICEVCHTQTAVHRYNSTGPDLNHKNANNNDCTVCHPHRMAFGASCGTCHGYPPNSTTVGAGGLASPATGAITYSGNKGAHVAHTNEATFKMKCETCHGGYTENPMGNNKIEMGFAINNTNYPGFAGTVPANSGTFTGNATLNAPYQWYTTSQHGTTINRVANAATCSVYCHGSTLTGGSASAPSWVGTNQATCTNTCHGMSAATPPNSGSHVTHAGNSGTNLAMTCEKCHGAHPDNTHVNGTVKWDLAGVSGSAQYRPNGGAYAGSGNTGKLAPSTTFGQCNNLYCHSSVQGPTGANTGITYAQPTWGNAVTCGSCHWGDTLSFKVMSTGSHRKHIVAYAYQCNECHNTAGHNTTKHADGSIDVTFTRGGTYNQPGTPGNGYNTCSSTACHAGAATDPTWGGTPMPTDCSGCHGNASSRQTLTPLHYKHIGNAAYGGNFTCSSCHVQTINNIDNITITNKALHADGMLNYSGVMAGRNKTCANFYCHSNGKGTWVNPSTWAAATPLGCDGCHGKDNGTGMPLASAPINSHPKHAPLATDCYKCHYRTASTTAGQLLPGTVDHLDRTIDARLTKPFAFTNYSGKLNTDKTCSATYCHGGLNSPTPSWGSANSTACASCHESNKALAGAHMLHYSSATLPTKYGNYSGNMSTATAYRFTCSSCHSAKKGASHVNGPKQYGAADIFFGFTSATKKGVYNYGAASNTDTKGFTWSVNGGNGAGNCNSTYCHSNGQGGNGASVVSWSTTNRGVNCTACHGNEANAGTLSGAHAVHMNPTANLGGSFKCADCHAVTITNTDNRTLASKAKHVNKFVDYSGVMAGRNKACANFYCHSNGKGTWVNPGSTWAAPAAIGCDGCHGLNNGTGMPLASAPINSHPKHNPTAAQCYYCHYRTASSTAPGQLLPGTVDHLDRTIDARLTKVNSFANYSGKLNADKTCSATYCHGGLSAPTPSWGSANSTNCLSCHESSKSIGGAHMLHYSSATLPSKYANYSGNMSTATAYRFTCSSCHSEKKGALHANGPKQYGAADVFFGFTSATMKGSYNYGTGSNTDTRGFTWSINGGNGCNTTYCHSNGRNGNGASAVSWSTTNRGANCNACHGNENNAGTLSGAHAAHLNTSVYQGGAFKCSDCHATTISNTDNRTLASKAKHINKFVDYSGANAGKNKTCSNIYCHSNGRGTWVNPPAWTSGTSIRCSGCHGSTAANLTSGSHSVHITAGALCSNCHFGTTTFTNNTSINFPANHINRSAGITYGNQFKNVNVTATGTTSCSAISCHSNGTQGGAAAVSWGASLNCAGCHPTLSAAHIVHANLSLTTGVTFYNYTANKSTGAETSGARYGFGCATCHPLDEATYHIDGSVEVQLTPTVAGGFTTGSIRQKNTANSRMLGDKSCEQVYCHSDGSSAAMVDGGNGHAPAWTTTFAVMGGDRCAKCHLNSPQTAAHNAHQVGIHYDNIFTGTSGKLTAGTSGSVSHGVAGQATTITCNTCHYKTMSAAANDQNLLCKSCHTTGHTQGDAKIADFSFHVNGNKEISFYPSLKVVSKAQIRTGSFSNYSGIWHRNLDVYKNSATAWDQAKVALVDTMYNSNTKTCSNIACHNLRTGQGVVWTDTTISCQSCHSAL